MRHVSLAIVIFLVHLTLFPSAVYSKYYYGSKSSDQQKPPGKNAILLSNVRTLTLRANRVTAGRRVPPIPQLKCVGPSQRICKLYTIETMRCKNEGYDYDEEDVQWTCESELPPEFKLGSTDVVCEGFRNSDDRWVLKGSCGVEYRMLLTDRGEERFGHDQEYDETYTWVDKLFDWGGDVLLYGLTLVVLGIFFLPVLAMLGDCFGLWSSRGRNPENGRGWGDPWGWGGGGGGGGGPPPPPYPGPPRPYSSCDDRSWTPGFWTGALGGSALGFQLGRSSATRDASARRARNDVYGDDYASGSSGPASSRYSFTSTGTGTGFGSTRRR